jgi:hypothetical protein
MKFGFSAKHRGIWPAGWLCEALCHGVMCYPFGRKRRRSGAELDFRTIQV